VTGVQTCALPISLIQAQRAYEMNSKVIQTGDEMLSTVTNMR
jgi:flagellar basal body rod protein FlgG